MSVSSRSKRSSSRKGIVLGYFVVLVGSRFARALQTWLLQWGQRSPRASGGIAHFDAAVIIRFNTCLSHFTTLPLLLVLVVLLEWLGVGSDANHHHHHHHHRHHHHHHHRHLLIKPSPSCMSFLGGTSLALHNRHDAFHLEEGEAETLHRWANTP